MVIRVYLIEDHPLMRETLCDLVELTPGLEFAGAAESAEEALEWLADGEADLLLVDISLPGLSGLELVEIVRERWPELRCLIVSGHRQQSHVERAMGAGAGGYVMKGDAAEIPRAIESIFRGETYLSRELRER